MRACPFKNSFCRTLKRKGLKKRKIQSLGVPPFRVVSLLAAEFCHLAFARWPKNICRIGKTYVYLHKICVYQKYMCIHIVYTMIYQHHYFFFSIIMVGTWSIIRQLQPVTQALINCPYNDLSADIHCCWSISSNIYQQYLSATISINNIYPQQHLSTISISNNIYQQYLSTPCEPSRASDKW